MSLSETEDVVKKQRKREIGNHGKLLEVPLEGGDEIGITRPSGKRMASCAARQTVKNGISAAGKLKTSGPPSVGSELSKSGVAELKSSGPPSVGSELSKPGVAKSKSSGPPSVGSELSKSGVAKSKSSGPPSVGSELSKSGVAELKSSGPPSVGSELSKSGVAKSKPSSLQQVNSELSKAADKPKRLKLPPSSYVPPTKRQKSMEEDLQAVDSRQRKQDPTWSKCFAAISTV